jgi:hypothetical protein
VGEAPTSEERGKLDTLSAVVGAWGRGVRNFNRWALDSISFFFFPNIMEHDVRMLLTSPVLTARQCERDVVQCLLLGHTKLQTSPTLLVMHIL